MEDSIKNSVLIKQLKLSPEHQWILYDSSFQDFFEWSSVCISDENLLDKLTMREYRDLDNDNHVVHGGALEQRLQNVNKKLPHVLDVTDADVRALEAELEHLVIMEGDYEVHINDMTKIKGLIVRNCKDVEQQILEEEQTIKRLEVECVKASKDLMDLQSDNLSRFEELNSCYSKLHSPPLFMAQMPLDKYLQSCETIANNVQIFMDNTFKTMESSENDSDQYLKSMAVKLEHIREKLCNSEWCRTESQMELNAMQRIIQLINVDQRTIKPSELTNEIKSLEQQSEIYQKQKEVLLAQLRAHIQRHVEQKLDFIVYENNKLKYERAKTKLENIRSIAGLISEALTNAEMIWMFMQLDLDKAKNRFDGTSEILVEAQAVARRIELMQLSAHMGQSTTPGSEFVTQFGQILSKTLGTSTLNYTDLKSCMIDYEKMCRMAADQWESVLNRKFYKELDNTINQIKRTETYLTDFLYDGPVNRPQLKVLNFEIQRFKAEQRRSSIETTLKRLKYEFHQNISEMMFSDRLFRSKQLLWIWFLTEPKKLLNAIDEVKRMAANKQNSAIQFGIQRKQVVKE